MTFDPDIPTGDDLVAYILRHYRGLLPPKSFRDSDEFRDMLAREFQRNPPTSVELATAILTEVHNRPGIWKFEKGEPVFKWLDENNNLHTIHSDL